MIIPLEVLRMKTRENRNAGADWATIGLVALAAALVWIMAAVWYQAMLEPRGW